MSSRRNRDDERRRYRELKATELEEAGEPALALEVRAGRCACGCGDRIASTNVRTFYADERHRKAHHRRRLDRLAEAAGVPARLSVERLKATNGNGDRPADAQTPPRRRDSKPRAGVSVYLPTPDVLEAALNALRRERKAAERAGAFPAYLENLDAAIAAASKALERRRRKPGNPTAALTPRLDPRSTA